MRFLTNGFRCYSVWEVLVGSTYFIIKKRSKRLKVIKIVSHISQLTNEKNLVKARIHCEMFLWGHFMNTYFTIVFSLCKLPRNVHNILFEHFHEIWKFWKSIFRISVSWKTFLLNLFSCLINSFIIDDVCENLKENLNIK